MGPLPSRKWVGPAAPVSSVHEGPRDTLAAFVSSNFWLEIFSMTPSSPTTQGASAVRGRPIAERSEPPIRVGPEGRRARKKKLTADIKPFICSRVTPQRIRAMRAALGLSQEKFAALLGITFVSVNKWENGASSPTGLSQILLALLENALARVGPVVTLMQLRRAGGVPLEVVRVLAELERQKSGPHL